MKDTNEVKAAIRKLKEKEFVYEKENEVGIMLKDDKKLLRKEIGEALKKGKAVFLVRGGAK